jgi:hypothetical protein
MVFAIAKISAFGDDGFLRQRYNGWYSWRNALDGTPAGALPYIALMVAVAAFSLLAGIVSAGGALPGPTFLNYVFYTFTFWAAFWAVTRVPGSLGASIKTSSTTYVVVFVMFVVLPAPFLSSIASNLFYQPEPSIWDGYLLRPVLPAADYNPIAPPVWSVIFLLTAAYLHVQAEANRRRRSTHTPPQELQHA